eukprot:898258-Alexandrium_andersonii.AAC.1
MTSTGRSTSNSAHQKLGPFKDSSMSSPGPLQTRTIGAPAPELSVTPSSGAARADSESDDESDI